MDVTEMAMPKKTSLRTRSGKEKGDTEVEGQARSLSRPKREGSNQIDALPLVERDGSGERGIGRNGKNDAFLAW